MCACVFWTGIWTHIAVVYQGSMGKMEIFVNGQKILKTKVTKHPSVTWSTPITIGKDWSNNYFEGDMDELYIFSSALMDTEIQGLKHECEFTSGGE